MLESCWVISAYTYNPLTCGYCTNEEFSEALALADDMMSRSVSLTISTYNTFVDGFCKCRRMIEVREQFGNILGNNLVPDIVSYNCLIYGRNKALIKELSIPSPDSQDLHFSVQYSQSFYTQCIACLWKQYWSYWRNPPYAAVRIFFTTIIALLFGTIFWDLGSKRRRPQDLFNAMGSMYAAVLFIGVQNALSVQPVVAVERTVFYREKAAGMYSALPYAFGQVMIEVPYVFVQAMVYGVIVYAMIGFEWTAAKFLLYMFFMYFTLLYFTFYGMMSVAMTPNSQIAAVVSAAFYSIWNLFSGFIVPRPRMPVWWRWYYWASPVSWTLYGLVVSQYGDVSERFSDPGEQEQVKEFLRRYFGFRHDYLPLVSVMIVMFTLLFGFIFAFSVRTLNFQRR